MLYLSLYELISHLIVQSKSFFLKTYKSSPFFALVYNILYFILFLYYQYIRFLLLLWLMVKLIVYIFLTSTKKCYYFYKLDCIGSNKPNSIFILIYRYCQNSLKKGINNLYYHKCCVTRLSFFAHILKRYHQFETRTVNILNKTHILLPSCLYNWGWRNVT